MNPLVAAGLISAGGSMLSGLVSDYTGKQNMERQAQLSYENWKKQFDETNRYNLPIKELTRWSAAGVNPLFNMHSAQMVGTGSSRAVPQSITPQFAPIDLGSNFNTIMNALLSARNIQGKSIENSRLGDMLDAQIKLNLQKAGYQELMNDYQAMANDVYQRYGSMHERAKIKNLMKDTALKASQILLNDDLSEEAAASAMHHLASEAHERALAVLGQKEIDYFDRKFNVWSNLAKSQIHANNAGASKDVQVGKYYNELGISEHKLRDPRYTSLILENGLRAIDFEYKGQEKPYELKTLEEAAAIAEKNNDTYYARFVTELIGAVANSAVSITAAGKMYKGMKAIDTMQKSKSAVGSVDAHVKPDIEKGVAVSKAEMKSNYPTLYHLLYE